MLAFAPYFQRVDPEDIAARDVEDLYGALLSHWQFARAREPGKAKIRVFNPVAGEHGWSSRHTVVEIVNDDMPFLVDSASMEVNRQGLTLHLIVHPIFAVERDASGALKCIDPAREQAGRAARVVHAPRGRSPRRSGGACRSWPRASSACSATCARR